jgi:hypothetical protein
MAERSSPAPRPAPGRSWPASRPRGSRRAPAMPTVRLRIGDGRHLAHSGGVVCHASDADGTPLRPPGAGGHRELLRRGAPRRAGPPPPAHPTVRGRALACSAASFSCALRHALPRPLLQVSRAVCILSFARASVCARAWASDDRPRSHVSVLLTARAPRAAGEDVGGAGGGADGQ